MKFFVAVVMMDGACCLTYAPSNSASAVPTTKSLTVILAFFTSRITGNDITQFNG